jgi:hypothetical protein
MWTGFIWLKVAGSCGYSNEHSVSIQDGDCFRRTECPASVTLTFYVFHSRLQLEMDPDVSVTPLTAQEEHSSDQMNLTVYF